MKVFFDTSNRARFDFKIPIQKTIVRSEDLPNYEGKSIVNSSKVIVVMDGDYFLFRGEGSAYCVVGVSCFGDGSYYLSFDSPVTLGIGQEYQDFPAGKEIPVPATAGFGLEYTGSHFYCQFNEVENWNF